MNDTTTRPYAAQCWKRGLFDHSPVGVAALQILAQDLHTDARLQGITEPPAIELWENDAQDSKGLFAGDTSGLPAEGWTKLASL